MLVKSKYDYNKKEDVCYYESSNILKSVCHDNEDDFKTLDITFKNGKIYQYTGIPVNKYIMFKNASSQGKVFSEIKTHPFQVIGSEDVDDVKKIIEEAKQKMI